MSTLIVDDEPIARSVLREELETLPDIKIVGEAENGKCRGKVRSSYLGKVETSY